MRSRAERPVREVEIYRAELLDRQPDCSKRPGISFEVEVSSGTYVRTLIETLGDAYCEDLRRTAVGAIGIGLAGEVLTPLRGAFASCRGSRWTPDGGP